MSTWTARVAWPTGDTELVDVQASSWRAAQSAVRLVLAADYEPGWCIEGIEERPTWLERHVSPENAALLARALRRGIEQAKAESVKDLVDLERPPNKSSRRACTR